MTLEEQGKENNEQRWMQTSREWENTKDQIAEERCPSLLHMEEKRITAIVDYEMSVVVCNFRTCCIEFPRLLFNILQCVRDYQEVSVQVEQR